MTENNICQGLPAQVDARCRVLVLGSMPGVASLQQAQYYAHPRNRFWPLMETLLGVPAALDYPQRLVALRDAGVGLWDVIGRCQRRGSLDAAIVRGTEVPNALAALIADLPDLQLLACNGAAAQQAFMRLVAPQLAACPPLLALPSTSPANAAFSAERLRACWQPITRALAAQP